MATRAGSDGSRLPDGGFEIIAILRPTAGSRSTSGSRSSFVAAMRSQGRAVDVFASRRGMATSLAGWADLPVIVAVGAADMSAATDIFDQMKSDHSVQDCYVAPPRYVLSRASGVGLRGTSSAKPSLHWGMDRVKGDVPPINAQEVLVGVVDSGVDRTHPDLKDAVFSYENFTGEPDKDIDGHGTHVCGIIAGRGLWPAGMTGVSNARLVVCKGLSAQYSATAYYRALRAASEGAKIVNLSLGGTSFDQAEQIIITRAQDRGVLFIAAMGNEYENGNEIHYPAALKGVVAVGAVGEDLKRADFSNTGEHITVVAPGVKIWSTAPAHRSKIFGNRKNYAVCDGTSMAAPFVAGVAAILYAKGGRPDDTSSIVAQIPVQHCSGQSCWTSALGHGIVTFLGNELLGVAKKPKRRKPKEPCLEHED
jgi:Subtilase family